MSWCIYSGETDVCAGIKNPGLVRHTFFSACPVWGLPARSMKYRITVCAQSKCGYKLRLTPQTSFSLEYMKPKHIKIMITSNITYYTCWISHLSDVGQQLVNLFSPNILQTLLQLNRFTSVDHTLK